jgi:4-amino-4-deoxy-L-arabinose transferase-like glycosyltransferase
MNKTRWTLLLITCTGALLRFWQLGSVPHGVSLDELGYIYNAFSVAQTGKNIFGQSYPLLTYVVKDGFPFMPVPIYASALIFHFLPLSAFAGRFANALLGTLSIVLVYVLAGTLSKKKSIGLAAAFAIAVSPWHIFFSRTAYDTSLSTFFYLLAIVSFLSAKANVKLFALSWLCLLLALFSYRGASPLSMGVVAFFVWASLRMHSFSLSKTFNIFIVFCVPLVLFGIVGFANRSHGFFSEAGEGGQSVATMLGYQMNESEGSLKIKRLFLNKPLFYLEKFSGNYLDGYAPGMLFIRGEASQIYSMWMRGKVYLFEALLIGAGILYILRAKEFAGRKSILMLLVISGLPGMISGAPYATRNFFMSIPLALLTGTGIVGVLSQKRFRRLGILFLIVAYGYSVSHFLFDYYERYAYQREESWVKSMKDVSSMTKAFTQSHRSFVEVAQTTLGDMLQYAFYIHGSARSVQQAIAQANPAFYDYNGVLFTPACPVDMATETLVRGRGMLLFVHDDCMKESTPSSRIKDYFGNTVWKVYQPENTHEGK